MPFDNTTLPAARVRKVKVAKTTPATITGSLGFPSKMPGTSYGIPAQACITGAKLHAVPDTVCSSCYALKGNYGFKSVRASQETRLAGITHPRWVPAMVAMLTRAHGLDGKPALAKVKAPGFHRWHDAGDLQSVDHLARICEIAAATPAIAHWLPTREVSILAAFKAQGGVVPGNLAVRVSATKVDGAATKTHPLTSTVHHKHAPSPAAHVCPAPTQGNECGACRACWSHDVAEVSYHKH